MNVQKRVWQALVFAFFFLVAIWNLTHASLWFDETVEFEISTMPLLEMYPRIVGTYQPPLYNYLLHFWLMISESEWWFRFSGVVFGVIGTAGLYLSVEKLYGYRLACLTVIGYSVCYNVIYYVQECAEYALLLGVIPWLCYGFLLAADEPSVRNIAIFIVACVLAMYTQYGAAFAVVSSCLVLLGHYLVRKNRPAVQRLAAGYAIAGVTAGIPLLVFFLIPQIQKQQSTLDAEISFGGGLKDSYLTLCNLIQWTLFGPSVFSQNRTFLLCMAALAVLWAAAFVLEKQGGYRLLALMAYGSYLLYYIAIKTGIYGWTSYEVNNGDNRYNLFLAPIAVLTIAAAVGAFFHGAEQCFGRLPFAAGRGEKYLRWLMWGAKAAAVTGLVLFTCRGLVYLKPNWVKEDIRGAVQCWYDAGGPYTDTLVYPAAYLGFTYYFERNDAYRPQFVQQIHMQPGTSSASPEAYTAYLKELYGETMPSELFLIGSHINEADFTMMVETLQGMGYEAEQLFEHRRAQLYRLSMPA